MRWDSFPRGFCYGDSIVVVFRKEGGIASIGQQNEIVRGKVLDKIAGIIGGGDGLEFLLEDLPLYRIRSSVNGIWWQLC